ncbi:MAG TPA: acetyl-CoA decarbonylase/synthase complex subunit gamma [Anaerolineales bacterium]|nr:acetyl-CoA decarbonylase/synthase complex subunit gamma [Anaerolineales bacterium]
MPLSGLEIYKLLPQTNCKECGYPTCLAFAMKLAAKQAELKACPYVTDESKAKLEAASAPPIRLVELAGEDGKIAVGNETVLYRHEKTFYHRPGLFLRVRDTEPAEALTKKVAQADGFQVDYVGIDLGLDGFAVEAASGDPATFAGAIQTVRGASKKPLILLVSTPELAKAGIEACAGTRPLLHAATADNAAGMAEVAKAAGAPLAVRADSLDGLAELTQIVSQAGVEDIVLDPMLQLYRDSLHTLTQLRRLALRKNLRSIGYPILTFPGAVNGADEPLMAAEHIAKYAGFIVIEQFDPATLYPLLVLRQNIYTDPQKPIQVQPGVYEINAPDGKAPVLVTTNFSITYFSVANEVEGSGWPAWLVVADAEGMSVLTAWAAGKFDAERIAKAVKGFGVPEKVGHQRVIIPGAVAVLSGELEEELPGWEIMVGPREAVDIGSFLKAMWPNGK